MNKVYEVVVTYSDNDGVVKFCQRKLFDTVNAIHDWYMKDSNMVISLLRKHGYINRSIKINGVESELDLPF